MIQIWYLVRYKDAEGRLRSGWVWGGTKNKDEGRYIGGDTEPRAEIEQTEGRWIVAWSFLFPATEAYAETLSPTGADPPPADNAGIPLPAPDTLVYLVNIPVLGWAVSVATISAVILFVVMLGGMIAKAIWDQTEKGRGTPPAGEQNYPAVPCLPHCIFGILGSDVCPAGERRAESDDGPLRVSDRLHVAARVGKTRGEGSVRVTARKPTSAS